jgi:hypothetical protein
MLNVTQMLHGQQTGEDWEGILTCPHESINW